VKELLAGSHRMLGGLAVLALLGLLMALGVGRKRGSPGYRWRVALWVAVVSLFAGAQATSGCSPVTCYKPLPPPDYGQGRPEPERAGDQVREPASAPHETKADEGGDRPGGKSDTPPPHTCYYGE